MTGNGYTWLYHLCMVMTGDGLWLFYPHYLQLETSKNSSRIFQLDCCRVQTIFAGLSLSYTKGGPPPVMFIALENIVYNHRYISPIYIYIHMICKSDWKIYSEKQSFLDFKSWSPVVKLPVSATKNAVWTTFPTVQHFFGCDKPNPLTSGAIFHSNNFETVSIGPDIQLLELAGRRAKDALWLMPILLGLDIGKQRQLWPV